MRPRRRVLSPEAQRELVTRGGSLAALSQHPSWPDLEDEINKKIERLRKRALATSLSQAPVNQRELDYVRGFIDGMTYLVAVPNLAESRLEHYLKERGAEMEGASR
jgi:hypothetical protein